VYLPFFLPSFSLWRREEAAALILSFPCLRGIMMTGRASSYEQVHGECVFFFFPRVGGRVRLVDPFFSLFLIMVNHLPSLVCLKEGQEVSFSL